VNPRHALRWTLGIGLTGFLLLAADELSHGWFYRSDFTVDAAMTRWAAAWPAVHTIGFVLSEPGSALFATAVTLTGAVLLLCWRQRRRAFALAAGSMLGGLLVTTLKPAIGRPLPPFIAQRFPHGFAFPSGHTMGATASVALAVLLLAEGIVARRTLPAARAIPLRRAALGSAIAIAGLVGIARILAQNHWVSDVLGSWCLGGAIVAATLLAAGEWRGPGPWFRASEPSAPERR